MDSKDIKIDINISKTDDRIYSQFMKGSIKLLKLRDKKNQLEATLEDLILEIELLETHLLGVLDDEEY